MASYAEQRSLDAKISDDSYFSKEISFARGQSKYYVSDIDVAKIWHFYCSKCKRLFTMQSEVHTYHAVPKPNKCLATLTCVGKKFLSVTVDNGNKDAQDYQQVRVQEQVARLAIRSIRRSTLRKLTLNLSKTCKFSNVSSGLAGAELSKMPGSQVLH